MTTPTPTIREHAEQLISIGTNLSASHPAGTKISDHAKTIIHILNAVERTGAFVIVHDPIDNPPTVEA